MFLLAVNFCTNSDMKVVFDILATVITVVKIVIPILLVVFGMLDLGRAVTGAKDDEIKKSIKSFTMRCIAAVVIFLIPSIVGMLMSLVSQSGIDDGGWRDCAVAMGLISKK